MTPEMAPEMGTLKATWMSGDYGTFAKYLEPSALEFLGASRRARDGDARRGLR